MNMVRSIRPHRSYGGDHATIRSPCRRDVRALAGDGRRGAAIVVRRPVRRYRARRARLRLCRGAGGRSEEHTSELQSLMRISYAVFCLKKKKTYNNSTHTEPQ